MSIDIANEAGIDVDEVGLAAVGIRLAPAGTSRHSPIPAASASSSAIASVPWKQYGSGGIVTLMLLLNWELALVTFALVPVLTLGAAYFRLKARDSYRAVRTRLARLNAFLQGRYHQPSDQLDDTWVFDGMIEDATLGFYSGWLVAQADVSAMLTTAIRQPDGKFVLVGNDNGEDQLKKIPGVRDVVTDGEDDWKKFSLRVESGADVREEVFRLAVERHWAVRELTQRRGTLEDVFVELTHPDQI